MFKPQPRQHRHPWRRRLLQLALLIAILIWLALAWGIASDGITIQVRHPLPQLADHASERWNLFVGLAGLGSALLLGAAGPYTLWRLRRRAAARTARRTAEQELHDANERLSLAIEASHLSLWDFDIAADRISLDAHWATMIGLAPGPLQLSGPELAAGVHRADVERVFKAIVAGVKGCAGFQEEFRYRTASGAWKWIRCTGKVVERDARGWALRALGTNLDVTERKSAEEQIRQVAYSDWLTSLPNRYALTQHLASALARARRRGNVVAVCMIDLDDFKPINDQWGHESGDRLLRELAQRLKALLRASDFLARLGGDEFVVVIEDIDADQSALQLETALGRLHAAVEEGFEISAGTRAEVGMTGGVALFPIDATEADALLRQADVAMYQAKQNKLDRPRWWRLNAPGSNPEVEAEVEIAAFGSEARALLARTQDLMAAVTRQYIEAFYDARQFTEAKGAIFASLTPGEFNAVRDDHAQFIAAMLAPDACPDALAAMSSRRGLVHALVGVTAPMLVRSIELLRRVLSEQLNRVPMPARERYRLLAIADARLQEQLQIQLEAGARATDRYQATQSAPLPAHGMLWADAVVTEISMLGTLDGVRAVLLMRLNSSGVFAIEGSAGPVSEAVSDVLQRPGSEAVVDPNSTRGQGLSAVAWRSGQICSSASYARDGSYAPWRERAAELHVRSTLSVPVRNASGQAVAVLSFFGAFPNQFESLAMQQFARGVQQRWEQIWSRCMTPAPVIPERQAQALRERLFAGGMRMFLQPVVDLRSGALMKVEALARLLLADGTIVAPGVFLPLLGDTELDHLFRLGLDIALRQLIELDRAGLAVDVSVNLAPTTLLDKDCSRWVEDALRRHGVAPHRLSLELLETGGMDSQSQDEAIDELVRLGVKLVMDDLGSGYSSLRRLSSLPFHIIKIDQSLTLNLRKTPLLSLPLIRAIIQLGADLERQVVVEGLEDDGMIEAAMILGATLGQGYGLARPMAQEQFLAWHAGLTPSAAAGAIHTYLGALTHHWLYSQAAMLELAPALEHSPLARFFEARGLAGSEPAQWLARCRAEGTGRDTRDQLLAWLMERVREEI